MNNNLDNNNQIDLMPIPGHETVHMIGKTCSVIGRNDNRNRQSYQMSIAKDVCMELNQFVSLTLLFEAGPHKGEIINLTDTFTLGSDPYNMTRGRKTRELYYVMDKDMNTAASHVKLVLNKGRDVLSVRVIDLKSIVGTYVNGRRLPEGGIRQAFIGDNISLSKSILRVKKTNRFIQFW